VVKPEPVPVSVDVQRVADPFRAGKIIDSG
jgi:hypothetical protein